MTVDIKRLTAHLSEGQRDEIAKAYKQQAENETAAFLWCFFLGWMGAHRFYLHQWGQAVLRLVIAIIAIGIVVGGVIAGIDPTIFVLAALPFALVALIWEIIDLFRIDDEVSAHNLKLAESLIARTMLADTAIEQQAQAKLDEVVHHVAAETAQDEQREQSITDEAAASTEPVAAGEAIYVGADTGATAERNESTTITKASEDPNAGKEDNQPVEAGTRDWSETEVVSADNVSEVDTAAAGAIEGMAVTESVTHTHSESGYSVTDSVDTVVNESEAETEPAEETVLAADMTPITAAESEAPTWPNLPLIPEPVEDAEAVTPVPVSSTAVDVSDMGTLDSSTPVADIGTPGAVPIVVSLGDEAATVVDATTPLESIPVESYIPPIVPVMDTPVMDTPVMDTPAPVETAEPAPTDDAPETLAELAGLATVAAGAASMAEQPVMVPESGADPVEESGQPSHMLKRIRVTHQIKVNGEVIEETSAEELIDADADPEPVRQRLRDQLHRQASARMGELGVPNDPNNP